MKMVYLLVLVFSAALAESKGKEVESASIAFEFVGNTSLLVVPVWVNGRGPYRFLLDTGASHTLLSTALAKKLEIQNGQTENLITAGGSVPVTIRTLDTLQMGSIRMDRPQIAVGDFGLLGSLHVDGILGGDYLKSFNLFIDYAKRFVRIDRRF